MNFAFEKTKPVRIFQNVVDQIQTAIIDGRLQPGDTLPAEMKLKDMFETSRGTIREALRVLEQKGLVDIKTGVGGGAVVKTVDTRTLSEGLDLLIQCRKVSSAQICEFREGVEGMVAALAAERATKKDIKRLQSLIEKAEQFFKGPDNDWQKFVKIDVQVHIAIAEIAKNPVFSAVLHMVHEDILGISDRFALKGEKVLRENYKDLCEIVQAIGSRKADDAKALAREHVRKFHHIMQSSIS
jgi:DNA-binding FadR family transcriptional regulator